MDPSIFSELPFSTSANQVLWTINDTSTEPEIPYAYFLNYIRFMLAFLDEWQDVDWMPTFDMMLSSNYDPRRPARPHLLVFKGNVTVAPSSSI